MRAVRERVSRVNASGKVSHRGVPAVSVAQTPIMTRMVRSRETWRLVRSSRKCSAPSDQERAEREPSEKQQRSSRLDAHDLVGDHAQGRMLLPR